MKIQSYRFLFVSFRYNSIFVIFPHGIRVRTADFKHWREKKLLISCIHIAVFNASSVVRSWTKLVWGAVCGLSCILQWRAVTARWRPMCVIITHCYGNQTLGRFFSFGFFFIIYILDFLYFLSSCIFFSITFFVFIVIILYDFNILYICFLYIFSYFRFLKYL